MYEKKGGFKWEKEQVNFELIKEISTSAPVLTLLNFDLMFEVETNASEVGIRESYFKKEK